MNISQNTPCISGPDFLTYLYDKQEDKEYVLINMKDHNQGELFDTWPQFGPKRRKLLDRSWSGLFRKYLLPVLPVQKLASHFSVGMGRPTKELSSSLGHRPVPADIRSER